MESDHMTLQKGLRTNLQPNSGGWSLISDKNNRVGRIMSLSKRTLTHFYALVILVAVAFSFPAYAENTAQPASKIKVDNFGKISDTFYRGAQPKGNEYTDLASFGIKTVINLTSHDADASEPALVEKAGMKYFQIPMTTHETPSIAKITEFMNIVMDPVNQPVYVHCVGGKHRTGVMTAVYRMTQHGWNADQAFDEMKKFKFGASFLHPEFKQFVYDFYSKLTRDTLSPVIATTVAPVPNQ
jgi:protein tyrosine/serine phosphatase